MHTEKRTSSFCAFIDINGRCLEVSVEASRNDYYENYGADADGRRGSYMCIESEIEDIVVCDGMGNDITTKLEKKYPQQFKKLENIVLAFA